MGVKTLLKTMLDNHVRFYNLRYDSIHYPLIRHMARIILLLWNWALFMRLTPHYLVNPLPNLVPNCIILPHKRQLLEDAVLAKARGA